jgi:hypothetical protein
MADLKSREMSLSKCILSKYSRAYTLLRVAEILHFEMIIISAAQVSSIPRLRQFQLECYGFLQNLLNSTCTEREKIIRVV